MSDRINRQDITSRVLDAYSDDFLQISSDAIEKIGIKRRIFFDEESFFILLSNEFQSHFTLENFNEEHLEIMLKEIDFDEIAEVFGWFQIHRVYGVMSFSKIRRNREEASC